MNKRDNIYFAYRFDGYKPFKLKWKIYCFLRKNITVDSPSKVLIYFTNQCKIKE